MNSFEGRRGLCFAHARSTPALLASVLALSMATPLRGGVSLDGSFNPSLTGSVWTVAVQPDGKILIGGLFNTIAGVPRTNIARLNVDGTVDELFNAQQPYGGVYSIHVQHDGQIIVGGESPPTGIARLNPNGSPTPAFLEGGYLSSPVPEADGNILGFGGFRRIQRRDGNGELIASFPVPGWGEEQDVYALAVQTDGKILVGGDFNLRGITRLNADGSPDLGFSQQWNRRQWVETLCEQADGRILIAGGFLTDGGIDYYVSRLNADGSTDLSFNPALNSGVGGVGNGVWAFALQADGKILIGGGFTIAGTQMHSNLARLNPDGTLDEEFNIDVDGGVGSIAVQNDGGILLAGSFIQVAGQPRNGIARLNNTERATQSLTQDGSKITWLRGGTSPEITRAIFEHSNDGVTWVHLGDGVRIPGGWRLEGGSLPAEGVLRARGQVFGGQNEDSGASGIVEEKLGDGMGPITFEQAEPIRIPQWGAAQPSPSSIHVTGLTTSFGRVTVTLRDLFHSFAADVDVLLVGPAGQTVVLMSEAGSGSDLDGVTLVFDDEAGSFLPDQDPIPGGVFKPTNLYGTNDYFGPNAPPGPYGSALSVFKSTNPNGEWHLYVYDNEDEDFGTISGGWSLSFSDIKDPTPSGDADPNALDKWHGRYSPPANTPLSVASGPNGFVAVGAPGAILTSTDGVEWTNRVSGTNAALRGVGYGNGTFAAVGDRVILTSTDGVAWSNRLSDTYALLRDVAYGNGRFVAVGGSGRIRVSSDGGATWQAASSGNNLSLVGVTYGQGRFVAVGSEGIIHASTDGLNWVTVRSGAVTNYPLSSVTYGGGQFVAVGDGRTILTSPDGASWTRRTAPPGNGYYFFDVIYANGSFVCGGINGTLLTSSDGINWRTNLPPATFYHIQGLAFDGETFVTAGVGSSNLIFQSDPVFLRPPRIVRQPRDTIVRLGGTTNLNVIAAGSSPFTFRWQRDGVPLPGGTNQVLMFRNTPVSAEALYTVTVGNTMSAVTSSPAFLRVNVPPSVALQPLDQSVVPGGAATFSIEMNGTPPFYYRWRQPGSIYTMLTNRGRQSFFSVPSAGVTHEGVYGVLVSNNFGSILSRGAQLTILADTDADGLPDVWETAHGLNTNDLADAMLDSDGDGLTNLDEYRAGTNPTNAVGGLVLRAFRTNETFMLEFEAESNRTYTVQRADALDAAAWTRLLDFAARTNRRIETLVEAAAATNRFYRLITPRQP